MTRPPVPRTSLRARHADMVRKAAALASSGATARQIMEQTGLRRSMAGCVRQLFGKTMEATMFQIISDDPMLFSESPKVIADGYGCNVAYVSLVRTVLLATRGAP